MLLIKLSVSLFSRLENINPEENDMVSHSLRRFLDVSLIS